MSEILKTSKLKTLGHIGGMDDYRAEQRKDIIKYLSKHSICQFICDKQLCRLSVLVERFGCYNAAIRLAQKHDIPEFTTNKEFLHQYSLACYRLNCNLDPDSTVKNTSLGPSLIRYMLSDHIKLFTPELLQSCMGISEKIAKDVLRNLAHADAKNPQYLEFMKSEEMKPGSVDHILDEIRKRSKQKIKARTTALFRCPNCNERKCTFIEKQDRGLDEPKTLHLTCVECEYDWTKNF